MNFLKKKKNKLHVVASFVKYVDFSNLFLRSEASVNCTYFKFYVKTYLIYFNQSFEVSNKISLMRRNEVFKLSKYFLAFVSLLLMSTEMMK